MFCFGFFWVIKRSVLWQFINLLRLLKFECLYIHSVLRDWFFSGPDRFWQHFYSTIWLCMHSVVVIKLCLISQFAVCSLSLTTVETVTKWERFPVWRVVWQCVWCDNVCGSGGGDNLWWWWQFMWYVTLVCGTKLRFSVGVFKVLVTVIVPVHVAVHQCLSKMLHCI